MKDRISELKCNIDDMTAEELAFAAERLMQYGARDVTLEPVIMKKGRPATVLTVMCSEDEQERFACLLFKYTSTIGVRAIVSERYLLDRSSGEAETPYGKVRYKHVTGFGADRIKAEYDDLARVAGSRGIGITQARELVMPYIIEKAMGDEGSE